MIASIVPIMTTMNILSQISQEEANQKAARQQEENRREEEEYEQQMARTSCVDMNNYTSVRTCHILPASTVCNIYGGY